MNMPQSKKQKDIDEEINNLRSRLSVLDRERIEIEDKISRLQDARDNIICKEDDSQLFIDVPVNSHSSLPEKLTLFRRLFRGRDDVYPIRWESAKTGKSGYQPACRHDWVRGICNKPRIKCVECQYRELIPLTNETFAAHLNGEITIGVYPMLPDDTCWFLAGFLLLTSTRKPGRMMLLHLWKLVEILRFLLA
jgi:hypothetical protein